MTEISSAADLAADGHEPLPGQAPDYWYGLIDENDAAEFLHLTGRTMQAMRQKGGGARFIRISTRCIRYRRIDLRLWAESRMFKSTSDPGQAAA